MAEYDELTRSLHGLRDELRERLPVPAAAVLRSRATHQLRVRRATTVVLAAGAVAAVALGGTGLLHPTAGPPVPPADTPTAGTPTPTVAPTTGPSPITPSPRPSPLPLPRIDDPIADVDWTGDLTIEIAESSECPGGSVQFTGGTAGDPQTGNLPGMMLGPSNGGAVSYGDLTGDGRAEAILTANCFSSTEGLASGHGWRLLVVARADDGALRALGWASPPGAATLAVWVAEQQLLLEADPWHVNPADHFPALPGLVLSYQWDGERFVGWQPAAAYPPIVPLEPDRVGPPVRPRAVAAGLSCPDTELRFTRDPDEWGGTAAAPQAVYQLSTRSMQQHLFDLDHTGDRLLVTALECVHSNGASTHGLAVFERTDGGWQGISVLTPPPGYALDDWHAAGPGPVDEVGQLRVGWLRQHASEDRDTTDGHESMTLAYRWTGTTLVPLDE